MFKILKFWHHIDAKNAFMPLPFKNSITISLKYKRLRNCFCWSCALVHFQGQNSYAILILKPVVGETQPSFTERNQQNSPLSFLFLF